MKQNGRRKVTPEMIERMEKLSEGGLSHKEIAGNLKLSTTTVYNYLKKEEKRWLARVLNILNKKSIWTILFVALFVIFSAVFSIGASILTNYSKIAAEEARGNWFTYYQDYIDNRENVDARHMAEQYHNESITLSVKSLNFDFVSGVYQLSVQSSILSLMIFLASFYIPKSKKLVAFNLSAIALLAIAIYYFVHATSAMITLITM